MLHVPIKVIYIYTISLSSFYVNKKIILLDELNGVYLTLCNPVRAATQGTIRKVIQPNKS